MNPEGSAKCHQTLSSHVWVLSTRLACLPIIEQFRRHMASIYAYIVGGLAEMLYSMPNLSLRDSPLFLGGVREHAGIGRATGRMTWGLAENTAGSAHCTISWWIHSCYSSKRVRLLDVIASRLWWRFDQICRYLSDYQSLQLSDMNSLHKFKSCLKGQRWIVR